MVHDLKQQVEDIRMCLFDLVEQQHRVRMLGDGFGEEPALVEAHVARWRADQPRHGMALHILGHVETNQLDSHNAGKLHCHLGLADTGRAREQERANGFTSFP